MEVNPVLLEPCQDFRPKKVLIFKTVCCINTSCFQCGDDGIGDCCSMCKMERLILVEDVVRNRVLGHAFARMVRVLFDQRGFYDQRMTIPKEVSNRNILLGTDLLVYLIKVSREMYQGATASLLPPLIPVIRQEAVIGRLRYLLDTVKNSPRTKAYAILVSVP